VKLKGIQSHAESLNNLRYMAEHLQQLNGGNTTSIRQANDLTKAWDTTHSNLRERNIRIERTYGQQDIDRQRPRDDNLTMININTQTQPTTTTQSTKLSPSGFTGTGVNTSYSSTSSSTANQLHYPSTYHHRREVGDSLTTSPNQVDNQTQQSALGQSIGENGSVFTLTNIYTFADNSNNSSSLNDNNRFYTGSNDGFYSRRFEEGSTDRNTVPNSDKYTIKSFVEVFDNPQQETETERHIRKTHTSEHRLTRKTHTSASETTDFGGPSRYYHGHSTSTTPTVPPIYSGSRVIDLSATQLPQLFIEQQKKIREWLQHVEQLLLTDKIQKCDNQAIEQKKIFYKDLLDQTFEQERTMEYLNTTANEYYEKLPYDIRRELQVELQNFQYRLYDIKTFLSERLTKYNKLHKMLSDFERGVEDVRHWMRTAQSRLEEATTSDSRILENQLSRNQTLQHEIRDMQTTMNRLNRDIIELTHDADEIFARRLRDEMKDLNTNWSRIISSSKTHSQYIHDALKRNKEIYESIQEMEDWINDKDRESPADDGPIFYPDQIRERVEQYQRIQTELSFREHDVRRLIEQGRTLSHTMTSGISDLSQSLENLETNWINLQRKVDSKVQYYSGIYTLHDELRSLLSHETAWLDTLADAEEISEELDTLEHFVKNHTRVNYEKIIEIFERLQATKVSIPAMGSQINQFKIRWVQLHEDANKKLYSLNQAITDYQYMGHQITEMREWLRHTDATINSRLDDNVFADDVPREAEKLIQEFNQHEVILRSIEDKAHTLRSTGKSEAAKRLEQQLEFLKSQFLNLQTKFRHFQKPSDFEPKYARMRQILQDVEQNMHILDVRTDDPDVIHNQLDQCVKLYKTLADIKSEVEYVIRIGRGIVEKRQIDETHELTRQIDRLKQTYNELASKISTSKTQLDNVERHIRKFRKEYSQINDWLIKADTELRKIENKQVSKNTKEEIDWIRTTRNDLKKLEVNFETLKSLERSTVKEAGCQLPSLNEKVIDLKRQIDLLERRLKDRYDIVEKTLCNEPLIIIIICLIMIINKYSSNRYDDPRRYHNLLYIPFESGYESSGSSSTLYPVEYIIYPIGLKKGQVRKLEDDHQKFVQIFQEVIIRLEKLDSLLSDAERVFDLNKISQIQSELLNVRPQLDELLSLGQELSSRSEKYSRLVGPDTDSITRKFEDLLRRIKQIQDQQEKLSKERKDYIEKEEYGNRQQENNTTSSSWERQEKDSTTRREYYREKIHNRHERESRHRSPSESSDISAGVGIIDEEFKKKYLRCLAYMKLIERLYDAGEDSDDSDLHTTKTTRRERTTHDRSEYEEIEKFIRETEERAYVLEKTDVDQARRIREKIRLLREYLDSLKQRQYQSQTNEEIVQYNTRGELDSDFIYDVDDTRSVISEPAPHYNRYRKTVHSLERHRLDQQQRHQQHYYPQESEYYLQPLLRVRSLKAIDRALSAPSSPILQPRYRSYERSNVKYTKDINTKRSGNVDNYQSNISKSQSLPSSPYGFPLQPYSPPFIQVRQQPLMYRERVIDREIAERSHSQGESSRQAHEATSTRQAQQQQQQQAGATSYNTVRSSNADENFSSRSIPVKRETATNGGDFGVGRESYNIYQNQRYSGQGGATTNGHDVYSYRDYHNGQQIPINTYYNDRTIDQRGYPDQYSQQQYQGGEGSSGSYRQHYSSGGAQQQYYPQQHHQDYPSANYRPTNDSYYDQQAPHHRSNHPSHHHYSSKIVN
ncbi:unnamed protein product, partial [Didymodactylos carnosus]